MDFLRIPRASFEQDQELLELLEVHQSSLARRNNLECHQMNLKPLLGGM